MNLYVFYYKDPGFDDSVRLYAYTEDKDLMKRFKEERNMDRFLFKKIEDVTKSEYKKFQADHGREKLHIGTFYTRDRITYENRVPVKVLCTYGEEEEVFMRAEHVWGELSKYLFDARIFNDEIITALGKLLFMKFYGFYFIRNTKYADYFYKPYLSSIEDEDGFIINDFAHEYVYDDLRLFLKFNKNTFKLKDEEKKD